MRRGYVVIGVSVFIAGLVVLGAPSAGAQTTDNSFSVQVTPSPLVTTVKPGQSSTLELAVRNTSNATETLEAELRGFKIDPQTNQISLDQTVPADIKSWVTFANPTFEIRAGEVFTERLTITTPKDAGFSYAFAVVLSRKIEQAAQPGKPSIQGSVAVFTLINVDKPGATKSYDISSFISKRRIYEYLPTELTINLKNTGNSIVKPTGSVFIERMRGGKPLAELRLNPNDSYLLPDTTRPLKVKWNDGFPVYTSVKVADNAPETQRLTWDYSKIHKLRIGRYTAKLVGVYNDGQRDIPVTASVSFWVIPWRLLLMCLLVGGLLILGLVTLFRRIIPMARQRPGGSRRGNSYRS